MVIERYSVLHSSSGLADVFGDRVIATAILDRVLHPMKPDRKPEYALSRILNGSAGISADMALRLRGALGTSAEMWINMQAQYDLWQAEKKPRPTIVSFREPVHA